MAQVDIFIHVEAEPQIGVPLAQRIIDDVTGLLAESGHTLRTNKIRFLCNRCGDPMSLRQQTLVCDVCLADVSAEQQLDEQLFASPAALAL